MSIPTLPEELPMKERICSRTFGGPFRRGVLVSVAGLAAIVSSACSDSTGPGTLITIVPTTSTITVQTDQFGFSSLQIPITITNTSERGVVYDACNAQLEQNTATGWQTIWTNVCFTLVEGGTTDAANPGPVYGVPLGPGQTATFTVFVPVSAQPIPIFPPSIRGESGEYRLRVPISTELAGAVFEFSHDQSVSESFNVIGR
jgi:hypothetical protein